MATQKWSFWQRITRTAIRTFCYAVMRIDVEGLENVPASEPFIAAGNHLHLLDAPLGLCTIPRPMTGLAKKKWQKKRPFNWILAGMGNVIYVDEEKSDRQALRQCLAVLQAGGILGMYPEGTRSLTGGLGKGHTGVAYLSLHTSTSVLPIVIYGQEQSLQYWKVLRRAPVHIRIGPLIQPPHKKGNKSLVREYTEDIMKELARMLPPAYRGIYQEKPVLSPGMEDNVPHDKRDQINFTQKVLAEITVANALSLARVPLAVISFANARRNPWFLSTLHAVGCFFDIADGYVARKWGWGNSPHGADIDILCDHVGELLVMFAFAYRRKAIPRAFPWILAIRNIITDFFRFSHSLKPSQEAVETHPHKAFGTFDRAGRNLSGLVKITEFILVPLLPSTGVWLSAAHVLVSLYRGFPVVTSPISQKIVRHLLTKRSTLL